MRSFVAASLIASALVAGFVGTPASSEEPVVVSVPTGIGVPESEFGRSKVYIGLELSGPLAQAESVFYEIILSGTAESNDIRPYEPRRVYIPKGAPNPDRALVGRGVDAPRIALDIVNDDRVEPDETFVVRLTGASAGVVIGTQDTVVTILDDDTLPTASISDIAVDEGDDGRTKVAVTVTLSAPWARAGSVRMAAQPGTATADVDFRAFNRDLVYFEPGVTERTILVRVFGDEEVEDDETILLSLSPELDLGIGDGEAVLTIIDDD